MKFTLLHKLFIAIFIGTLIGTLLQGKGSILIISIFGDIISTVNYIIAQVISFSIPIIILGFMSAGIADLGLKGGKVLGYNIFYAYISTIFAGILAYTIGVLAIPNMLKIIETNAEEIGITSEVFKPVFELPIPAIMSTTTALILAIILGIVASKTIREGAVIKSFLLDIREVADFIISKIIIPLLPIYIFTVFFSLGSNGESFQLLGTFMKVYFIAISIHWIFIIMHYSIHAIKEGNPIKLFTYIKNILPAYFTAIGTQSSIATLPVTLNSARKSGLSEEIVDFSIPLNANIHMPGSMINMAICVLAITFITPSVGITSIGAFIPFLIVLSISAVSAPGVPGGVIMVASGFVVSILGFSVEMQSLIIALYMALDSFGTASNIACDISIAKFMSKHLK